MADQDGSSRQSPVVVIRKHDNEQAISVRENPFGATIELNFSQPAGKVRLQLLNAAGLHIIEKYVTAGNHLTWMPDRDLSRGIYFLLVTTGSKTTTLKLVKQ